MWGFCCPWLDNVLFTGPTVSAVLIFIVCVFLYTIVHVSYMFIHKCTCGFKPNIEPIRFAL